MMKNHFFTLRKILFRITYLVSKLIPGKSVSVLCFHSISKSNDRYSVSPEKFKKEIEIISKHSDFISFKDFLDNRNKKKSSVIITFDDGYKDIIGIVPIIKRYNIKPILFVLSNHRNVNRIEIENDNKLLTIKEIRYLVKNGFEIGSHSATHSNLSKISDNELIEEVINSRRILQEQLRVDINYFAYPKGINNKKIVNIVKKAGYKYAFTVEPGNLNEKNDNYRLPRTIIDKTHQLSEFPGVYSKGTYIIRKNTNRFKLWERFLSI